MIIHHHVICSFFIKQFHKNMTADSLRTGPTKALTGPGKEKTTTVARPVDV